MHIYMNTHIQEGDEATFWNSFEWVLQGPTSGSVELMLEGYSGALLVVPGQYQQLAIIEQKYQRIVHMCNTKHRIIIQGGNN